MKDINSQIDKPLYNRIYSQLSGHIWDHISIQLNGQLSSHIWDEVDRKISDQLDIPINTQLKTNTLL